MLTVWMDVCTIDLPSVSAVTLGRAYNGWTFQLGRDMSSTKHNRPALLIHR